jgi:transposase
MASVKIELDLPPEVEVRSYERVEDGHAFEVQWSLPEVFTCERCGHQEDATVRFKDTFCVIRDLDLWGQPSFFVYQPPFHQCSNCGRRQDFIAPFKRKCVSYTCRFEEWVVEMTLHSAQEEVARRLGVSAEMIDTILWNQLRRQRMIDPQRVVTDIGIDEISLKKRHKLYATVLSDLSDPARPKVLAVVAGRDQAAAEKALGCLSPAQRAQVRTHRTDMSAAYTAACAAQLPHSQQVIDRFHVAQKLSQAADQVRKKKTRALKRRLSPKQRRQFRSAMWAFRSRPEDLSDKQQEELDVLFTRVPELRRVYDLRNAITEVFDTAVDDKEASARLERLRGELREEDQELQGFFQTYDAHREGILAYFAEGKTSGVVEGLNNKARVITRRCYGVKNVFTLWQRLCLDVNVASDLVRRTIAGLKQTKASILAAILPSYT